MKKIIIGFDKPAALTKIQKSFLKMGIKDVEFIIKSSKLAVVDALEKEDIYACLLTMNIGIETWKIEEIGRLRDNCHVHIVPILDKSLYGSSPLQYLYSVGITSAILQKGSALKSAEIAQLLSTPRSLKDARIYYGIQTMEDHLKAEEELTDEEFEQYQAALFDPSYQPTLGSRYYAVAMSLTPKKNMQFLNKLGKNTLDELGECEEFYQILDILHEHGMPITYRKPKHLKKTPKNAVNPIKVDGDVLDADGTEVQMEQGEDFVLGDDELDTAYEEDTLDEDLEEDVEEPMTEDDAFGFVDMDTTTTSAPEPTDEQEPVFAVGEDAYGFSEDTVEPITSMEEESDAMAESEMAMDEPEEIASEDVADESMTEPLQNPSDELLIIDDDTEEYYGFYGESGESITEQDIEESLLNDEVFTREDSEALSNLISEEEQKEEELEASNRKNVIIGVSLVCVVMLLVALIAVFVIITAQRKAAAQAAQESANSEYDVLYSEPELEEEQLYELDITDTGSVVAVNKPDSIDGFEEETEREEISLVVSSKKSEQESSVSDNSATGTTYVTAAPVKKEEKKENTTTTTTTTTVKQSIQQKVTNTETKKEELASYPSYTYRPSSLESSANNVSFENGKTISGLDLVNALNSKSGKSCVVEFKDGTEISIKVGEASVSDISVRATYKIVNNGATLRFIEE